MVINSSGFSQNRDQHYSWYKDFEYFVSHGFPKDKDVHAFLQNLTHVFCCEDPYNFNLVYYAQKQGTKVYCQTNYEFCDNLSKPYLPTPDLFLMPSQWKVKEMEQQFGKDKVKYLPPPIDHKEFEEAREMNLIRKGKKRKFLHIIGTLASEDRNGTLDLLEAVKLSKSDFELTIHTQHALPMHYYLDDPRVKYRLEDFQKNGDLYKDFDALILPRRFGGLSLTTNEALMSALPVIMTNITPNKELLPDEWLVKAKKNGTIMTKAELDLYTVDHKKLVEKIDRFVDCSDETMLYMKDEAFRLALKTFSVHTLSSRYELLFLD